MAWQTPVFDRTEADVYTARTLINKINTSGYSSLTEDEKTLWDSGDLKGCRNVNDLNRIENNCNELATELGLTIETKLDWDYDTTPMSEDIQRICDNVSTIREALLDIVYVSIPVVPELPINDFDKMNDIEEILYIVHDTLHNDLMLWADLDNIGETWAELDYKELYWQNGYLKNE